MKAFARWLGLVLLALFGLQFFFLGRIALMVIVAPQSTSFQRSEVWRVAHGKDALRWRQDWVNYNQISDHLKRAVVASEDDGFANHDGVDWDAMEKAWENNTKAQQRAAQQPIASAGNAAKLSKTRTPKIVGGSTITQQMAKNLLLSGERTLLRKGQEFVLTIMIERLLSKRRILEIYLNSVEWGEGVFGAEAAAQHYFRKSASQLSPFEAARLSVMLPRPRYYEKLPHSSYLSNRAGVIVGRMGDAQVP